MPRETPHPRTIFHLIPKSIPAIHALEHPDNKAFVSRCIKADADTDVQKVYGLEIGFHVPTRPCPQVIAKIGRDADLIWPASSISAVQFSIEVNPESRAITCYDRGRFPTTIEPFGFKEDGAIRRVVLIPGIKYVIAAGVEEEQYYEFYLVWTESDGQHVSREVQKEHHLTLERGQNLRWAQTIDDGVSDVRSRYRTRL